MQQRTKSEAVVLGSPTWDGQLGAEYLVFTSHVHKGLLRIPGDAYLSPSKQPNPLLKQHSYFHVFTTPHLQACD